MIYFKEGVQLTITKAVQEILFWAETVWARHGKTCTVTSGTDGEHGKQSKHYTGYALDLRIRDLQVELLQPIVQGLQKGLGQDYDVVLERDHVHVEYDEHHAKK